LRARVMVVASLLFVVSTVLALAPMAQAQMPQPFSADMVMTPGRGQADSMTGKVYFSGQKFRMDMSARGHESTILSDTANKVGYMIMPQQKMYMEMRQDGMMGRRGPDLKAYDASNPCANEDGATCKKVGTEMVNGRMCDKWEVTKGAEVTRTLWIDKSSHIPIKTALRDGTVVEFKNIKEGPQPASLFEIPAGYQKMDMGGMMGGRPPR
jgi:outer membrane lipoprotein-sorting protein